MLETIAAVADLTMLPLQADPVPSPQPGPGSVVGGAVGAFLTTLVVGGLLVTFLEDFTVRMVDRVTAEPLESFLYGIVALVLLVVLTVLLVITIIGLVVAVPLLIFAYLVWAVGASLAFLAVGDRIAGRDDGWLKPLLVGAAINGGLALTGIGGVVSFAVGAVGFGAILSEYVG